MKHLRDCRNNCVCNLIYRNEGSAGTLLILVVLLLFLFGLVGVRLLSNPTAMAKVFTAIRNGDMQSTASHTVTALIGFDMSNLTLDDETANSIDVQPELRVTTPIPPIPTRSTQSLWSLIPIFKIAEPTNNSGTQYKLTYFDIDSARDKRFVTATSIDSERGSVIQDILSQGHIRPSIIEDYAFVFTSVPAEGVKSFSTTILLRNTPVPIPEIGMTEGGKLNNYHKYILIRGNIRGDELAEIVMHELGHIVGNMLTADQFKSFMLTRSMSPTLIDSWYDFYKRNRTGEAAMSYGNWVENPGEDFAEVFKTVHGKKSWAIRTQYGPVTSETKDWLRTEIDPLAVDNN